MLILKGLGVSIRWLRFNGCILITDVDTINIIFLANYYCRVYQSNMGLAFKKIDRSR